MKRVTSALGLTCVMIPVTVLLRLLTVARYSDTSINWFSYGVALFLTLVAVVLLLSGLGRKQPAPAPQENSVLLIAVLTLLSGAALTLGSLSDLFGWLTDGTVPAPVNFKTSLADRLLLIFLLLFGITGGLYLLYVGYCWIRGKACRPVNPKPLALLPVLWAWFRLARYTVSYVSAAGLGETIYDYGWLIFSLLFLLKLSQFIAGRRTLTCGDFITALLPAGWFGIAGCLSSLLISCLPASLLQHPVRAGSIVGWYDFPLAVLALLWAADALRKCRTDSATAEPVAEPAKAPLRSGKAENLPAETVSPAETEEDHNVGKINVPPDEDNQTIEALLKEFSSTDTDFPETTTDR